MSAMETVIPTGTDVAQPSEVGRGCPSPTASGGSTPEPTGTPGEPVSSAQVSVVYAQGRKRGRRTAEQVQELQQKNKLLIAHLASTRAQYNGQVQDISRDFQK